MIIVYCICFRNRADIRNLSFHVVNFYIQLCIGWRCNSCAWTCALSFYIVGMRCACATSHILLRFVLTCFLQKLLTSPQFCIGNAVMIASVLLLRCVEPCLEGGWAVWHLAELRVGTTECLLYPQGTIYIFSLYIWSMQAFDDQQNNSAKMNYKS